MSTDEILSSIDIGNIPVPVIAVFFVCVAGMIASGKPAETLGRVAACVLTYALMYMVFSQTTHGEDSYLVRLGLEGIPFLGPVFDSGGSITSIFLHDFSGFSEEFFKLYIFSAVVDTMLTVFHGLFESLGRINYFSLGLFLPWIARYVICCASIFVYAAVYIYIMSPLPEWLWAGLALVTVVMTALMLLSPLIDWFILWADLLPNRFIHMVSSFIKEYKVGGVLQVSFFTAFLLLSGLICLQEAVPALVDKMIAALY